MKYFKNFMLFEADGGVGTGGSSGNDSTDNGSSDGGGGAEGSQNDEKDKSDDNLERLLQSRLDKAMADERKKSASLQKEIEKMKREKMTADELKKYDDEKREKTLAEKEAALTDRENKLYAVKAIRDIGIEGSSDTINALTEYATIGVENADEIDDRLKNIKSVIDAAVQAECDKRFRDAGRTPKGAGNTAGTDDNNIARKIGKRRAESNKKAQGILDYYTKH